MAVSIEFTGVESLEKMLKALPDSVSKKAINTIFARAARPFVSELKKGMPASLRVGAGVKVLSKAAEPKVDAGITIDRYKKTTHKTRSGVAIPVYSVIYWQNYGTGLNRDKSHNFKTPLRSKKTNKKGKEIYKNRRTTAGIEPKKWVQIAWYLKKQEAERVVSEDAKTILLKIIQKYKV